VSDDDRRLTFWVIYERPKDLPEHRYVLRRQHAMKDGSMTYDAKILFADTIEEVRRGIPPGLAMIGPWDNDDPVIKEVWV